MVSGSFYVCKPMLNVQLTGTETEPEFCWIDAWILPWLVFSKYPKTISISQHLSFIYQFSTPSQKNVIGPYYIPQLTWFHFVIWEGEHFEKFPTKQKTQKCPNKNVQHLEFSQTFGKSPRFPSCNPFLPSALLRRARKGGCSSKSVLAKDVCTKTCSVSIGCWLEWSFFRVFGVLILKNDSRNWC